MKAQTKTNRLHNLWLTAGLLILYTATLLLRLWSDTPIDPLSFFAATGVVVGAYLLLSWMPVSYYTAILLFACVAQYFGMMLNFYYRFWWYDVVVHFFSGILLGTLGLFLCRLFGQKADSPLPVPVLVLFALFFAVSCAGLWEIYEYSVDVLFGMNTQSSSMQSAIDDTMQDIIAGTLGAGLYAAGLTIYLYLKRKKRP